MNTKYLFFLAVLLLFPFAGNTQDTGTLRVTGSSNLRVVPDEAVARFSYHIIAMEYESAVKTLGRESDQLKKVLQQEDFEVENLKTVVFNVGVNRIYSRGQQKDSGYVATQILEIKFPYESQRLVDLMNRLSGSKTDPDVTFSFQLSDQEMDKAKLELIRLAVSDARRKAEVISDASGTEISGIREISYGTAPGPEPPMYRMMDSRAADEPSYGGFNVQELSLSESIDITYSIEKE